MTYSITAYSRAAARRLGVTIVPSTRKNKKIDVISKKTKKKLASIGDSRYSDFPSYVSSHGMAYAKKRRALYHKRHGSYAAGTTGYYASKILW